MVTRVTLTDGEQRIAIHLAKCRTQANRAALVVDDQVSPAPKEIIERDGMGAELAFCKLFNVYPDLSIGVRSGGADCIVVGRSVDVKTTQYRTGRLLAVTSKAHKDGAELYVLLICKWPTYDYVGMTTKERLLSPESLTDVGHGSTYAMTQDQLSPMLTAEEVFGYGNK